MPVARTKSRSKLRLAFLATLASSCALITPLDPVRLEPQSCQGAACSATKRVDASIGISDAKAPEASTSANDAGRVSDASAPPVDCIVPPGAECNPVAQCGCDEKESCGLDSKAKQVRCLPRGTGTFTSGEHCTDSSECGVGLQCIANRICAPYCSDDADCHDTGKCKPATDPISKNPVPASGACSRWCDPFTTEPCRPNTSCYANSAEADDPHATCRYFYSSMTKARGQLCDYYNDCDRGLTCAQFGASVCTSFCKADAECPSDTPHCYMDFRVPLVAKPGEPVGQCVTWPCDDANLPPPQPWSDGPVWNLAQYVACTNRCGPSRDCYRNNCMDGERWGHCLDHMLESCAGAVGAPCRKQYVALACSDISGRTPIANDFTNCALAQPDCLRAAEQACAEQP